MKIHMYLLAFCLAGFAACGDDDDPGTTDSGTDATVDDASADDASADDASADDASADDASADDASTADASTGYYTGDPNQCDGLDFDTNAAATAASDNAVACFGTSEGDDEKFRNCVRDAVKATDADITDGCGYCYGVSANCGSEFCLDKCIADPGSDQCIQCRCDSGCYEAFDVCSGFSFEGDNCGG